MPINVIDIVRGTSVDGPGLRTSFYLAGCDHHCPGCHNPSTWDFNAGSPMQNQEILEIVEHEGFNVTFSGGDPMYQAENLSPILEELKKRGYNIWAYTGFTLEELLEMNNPHVNRALENIDTLVDGPFIQELRDPQLRFRGSSNQRIINLKDGTEIKI